MAAEAHAREQKNIYFCVMSKNQKDKFNYFKQLYQNNKFDILFKEKEVIYWLKLKVKFNWLDSQKYSVLSDIIFITKEKL